MLNFVKVWAVNISGLVYSFKLATSIMFTMAVVIFGNGGGIGGGGAGRFKLAWDYVS